MAAADLRGRHRGASIALVVLGSIILFLAGFAVWAGRQLLRTDDWVDASTDLLGDHEIQLALSTFLVDSLFDAVDVEAQVEQALPPEVRPLAGPAAGGLRELAGRASLQALQSPPVQQLWEDSNRAAHEQLLVVVEGGDGALSTEEGIVTLDLRALLEQVGERVGIDVPDELPEQIGTIEVLRSDELATAQDAVDLLKTLAYGLVPAALVLYGLAILLARGRRRETVRAIGFGWLVVGAALLVVRELAGDAVVTELASTASVEPAIERVWAIGTSLLEASAVALIGYGAVVVVGAWLAGPTRIAAAMRRGLAPLFHSPLAAYAALLVIVLLIFLWAPTEGTQRLLPSLVLLVLMVAGFEALRRLTVSEFPDETWADAGRRWRERIAAFRGSGSRAAPGVRPDQEQRTQQLERLAELHRTGVLDADELRREKARVLADDQPPRASA